MGGVWVVCGGVCGWWLGGGWWTCNLVTVMELYINIAHMLATYLIMVTHDTPCCGCWAHPNIKNMAYIIK